MNINNRDFSQLMDKIHPYPAKFPVDMAMKYVNKYTDEGSLIFDPFSGSGTTLLAATVLNRFAYGTDTNPIAHLLSSLKIANVDKKNIDELQGFANAVGDNKIVTDLYSYKDIEHWFDTTSITALSKIRSLILQYDMSSSSNILAWTALSSIINIFSRQESDTRYAAIDKPMHSVESILSEYVKKLNNIIAVCQNDSRKHVYKEGSRAILADARSLKHISMHQSINLILTSPPYPNTYDYYLYHKHRMLWMGYDYKDVMHTEIGSRREFSSLKRDISNFSNDMYQVFSEVTNLLDPNGHVVVIIGDGKIQGQAYDSATNMNDIMSTLNFRLIESEFTYLDNTSKSFSKSFRTNGKKEHFLVFRKD